MIGHEDWERFLSSIERLMTLQERTIEHQKELNRRNETLRKQLSNAIAIGTPINPPPSILRSSLPSVDVGSQRGSDAARSMGERVLEWLKLPTAPATNRRPTGTPLRPTARPAPFPPYGPPSQVPNKNIQCGNCGYEVTKPSSFCERCGVSFGAVYCRCGRTLLPGEKFCDNCGQPVA